MASNRSIDEIINDGNLAVEVVSNFNNIMVVKNNNHSLKGVLLPVNDENKVRLENFITECQKSDKMIEKNSDKESLVCIPDSTLSHTTDSNINNNTSREVCKECKCPMKRNYRRSSVSREVQRLTNHGFNECHLVKKNISRRSPFKKEFINGDDVCKDVKEEFKVTEINTNEPMPKRSRKTSDKFISKTDEVSIRQTKDRALKTKANEKIIDLCTRKSSKVLKEAKPKSEVKKKAKLEPNEDASETSPIKLSDTSIYDFVDEDYESEPIKALYKGNKSYFVDKGHNSVKLDKRSYKRKISKRKSDSKDDEIHSNPGIVSYEYKGTKFSINNIVWAKIPGYPFWPAHIKSFDNVSASKSQGKRCRINWIGWNQKSFLPLKSLLHFKEHFKMKYSSKFKSQKYKTAVELACKELGLDYNYMTHDMLKKSPANSDRNNSSQNSVPGKRKSVDLDDIFTSKKNSKDILDIGLTAKAYSDEDTDEEEKARSALITVESLEANKLISDKRSKQSDYDY